MTMIRKKLMVQRKKSEEKDDPLEAVREGLN